MRGQFVPDLKLKADDYTVLMAVDGKLSDGLRPWGPSGHGKFYVEGWRQPAQQIEWTVSCGEAAEHEAFVLLRREHNQPLTVELSTAGQSIRGSLPPNPHRWQRLQLAGLLKLPEGSSTLVLRLASAGGPPEFDARVQGIELVKPAVRETLSRRALAMRADPAWFQQARYGMMVHWTKQSVPLHGEPKSYQDAVADFDVEAFAESMQSTGAGFVVFTTSHALHYFPAPLQSLDRILPGRTTKRDLPADLAAALEKRGIKLFLYYHLGAIDDREWLTASGFWDTDTTKFFGHWKAMIREAGERYRERLAGWWFDDGATSYFYRNAPWESLAIAAKAGNPRRLVSFNAWELNNPTRFHDFCTGEGCMDPRGMDGLLTAASGGRYPSGTHEGLQASACLITESDWVHSQPNTPLPKPRWQPDALADLLRGFLAHKNVPVLNLEITQDGKLSPESIALFQEAASLLDRHP